MTSDLLLALGLAFGFYMAWNIGANDMSAIRKIFLSWLTTIPVAAVLAALLYWILGLIWP